MPDSRTLPEHVTLPLLTLVTRNSLDEDYQHVADRKAEAGVLPTRQPPPRRRAAVVAGLFGLMIVIAFVQTSRNAETAKAGEQELIAQLTERREQVRDQQATISELTEGNAALSAELAKVEAVTGAAEQRLLRVQGITGYADVRGPGVRIRVDNSPDGSSDGVVRDEDLAILVDGLWAAGADAIAINGRRLTALTPIRSVGKAIHIAAAPIRPPYTVLAIGDPDTLQARFAETQHGLTWFNIRNSFGFEWDMRNAEALALPGRRTPRLRSATPAESTDQKETP